MTNIFDVAKHILEKSGSMSTMKLQKLCYYSQAWSLVWNDKSLFPEDFEAWANCPVCPKLFAKTKGQFSVSAKDETGGNNDLTSDEKDTINKVIAYYGDKDAQWLSRLTHMEDPWKNARGNLPNGDSCSNTITKESMAMYYGSL